MDELRAGLEDSLSGRGRLMMLVGEPGIGKTRTSEEFATYARLRNVQVLWGRCYEGEGAPAYWPWVQIAIQRAFPSEQGVGARLRDDGTERHDVADTDRVIDSATGSEASLLQGSTTEIAVRIGLHSGEVIKEGEDFFGRNVIMAARVASQAQGGEILVSGVLKALVAGSDVPWGEKRTVGLKGLSGEHEIWPVAWESQGPKAVTR